VTSFIEIRDFDEVVGRLAADALLAQPLHDAFDRVDDVLVADIERHRPTDAFSAIGAFQTEVDSAPIPRFARVSVENLKDFRVAQALNFASDRYHYRKGPFAGRSTRGWFTAAATRQQRKIDSIMDDAARQIEQNWSSS
jgi:hypothetical protein